MYIFELEQTLGDSGGQGSLVCCSPRGCKESDLTERLNMKGPSFPFTLVLVEEGIRPPH